MSALTPRATNRSIIQKLKKTKFILNLSGHGRKRKMTVAVGWIIQRKIKVDRRKSASLVKSEIQKKLGISFHKNTIRNRLCEIGFYERVARKNHLETRQNEWKLWWECHLTAGNTVSSQMSRSSTFFDPMERSCYGGKRPKSHDAYS